MKQERFFQDRRQFLKWLAPIGAMMVSPAIAFDLLKALDPESDDFKKAKGILDGTKNILTSSTEIDYDTEFSIGQSLALEGFKRYGLSVDDPDLQRYVNLVGNTVSRNAQRPGIPYYFVVVDNDLYNAFSCPGGIIFVSSALVKAMNDESELAGVLAHEVAHVGHKHALQAIRRAKFFEGVTKITDATSKKSDVKKYQNMIGGLQSTLFDKGLDQNMEYEADASALETSYRTGYDPRGFVRVLSMLKEKEKNAKKKGSWFSTHPPLNNRIAKCKEGMAAYPDADGSARVGKRFAAYKKRLGA